MGNDFFETLTSDIIEKNLDLKQSIFNGVSTKNVCSFYNYRRNGKNILENIKINTKQNGFTGKTRNHLKEFEENLADLEMKTGNSFNKISNGISKHSARREASSDIVIILSDDSLSMDEFDLKKIKKNSIQYSNKKKFVNGEKHISSKEFKRRKVSVRLKKSSKIESLLKKDKFTSPLNFSKNVQTRKNTYNKNEYAQTFKTFSNNIKINLEEKFYNNSFSNNFDDKNATNCCDINKRSVENGISKKNASGSILKKKNSNNNTGGSSICTINNSFENKSQVTFPQFETIFVDTVNIDDTNSESSPLYRELQRKNCKNVNDKNIYKQIQQRTRFKDERNLQTKTAQNNINGIIKKKNTTTRLKGKVKKILKENIKKKHCKINVKNLSVKQIKRKIKESRYKAKRRRRSWSVSDVAREHDRRLNFFPEAGPSHIDYYALIKLPVVKPKVPINY